MSKGWVKQRSLDNKSVVSCILGLMNSKKGPRRDQVGQVKIWNGSTIKQWKQIMTMEETLLVVTSLYKATLANII